MFLIAAITLSKIQADWLAYLLQAQQPDNLVNFQWIAITTLGGVIAAMALYIRSLLAEIRAIEKERHAHDVSITEKVVVVVLENTEATRDIGEAIKILADRLERQSRATKSRTNNAKDRKSP